MGHPQSLWLGLTILLPALAFAVPSLEVTVNQAAYLKQGQPAPAPIARDTFSKGVDGISLWHGEPVGLRDEVRYPCAGLPEGDYTVGLLAMGGTGTYLCFAEHFPQRVQFYHNDTRVAWTAHTEPQHGRNDAGVTPYQAEMLTAKLHVKPTDVFRIFVDGACHIIVGPLRFYRGQADGTVLPLYNPPDVRPLPNLWLHADWTDGKRNGDTVAQTCRLYNPGVLPRTFTLQAQARDYLARSK
jgi:hypothetical protein